MCIVGEALSSSLSVLRTLRSVLIGSLGPLGRITLMVCYMYYTDVFVGQTGNNIVNLKDALKAELPDFNVNSNDLTQLVQGLCLFMGYPSCLCKPKKSVEESLKKISGELKEEVENYKCKFISIPKPSLNCNSCKSLVVCKCCVLDCIREVLKSNCKCVKGSNNTCTCSNVEPKRCCKDLLEKLKASLSLLNLKADMETLCKCPDDCCDKGVCTKASQGCTVCPNSKATSDYTVTGLGLLRPSPKRLAEKLEKFFGSGPGPKGSCGCKCGSGESCCCLACDSNQCAQACSCSGSGKCGHQSQPQPQSQDCPCKTFCSNINSIKVPSDSSDMTCCSGGSKCHCQVGGTCSTSPPGQTCCDANKSLKCLIRRLVNFFNGLSLDSSKSDCSKLCCEIFCVLKISYFLKKLFNASKGLAGKDSCGKCKGKGPGGNKCENSKAKTGTCCGGTISACKSPDCCQGCPECNAIKLGKALQELQYSGPCGQDLYRLLDDFLHYCCNVFMGHKDFIRDTVLEAVKDCSKCGKSGPNSKNWQACECSTYGSCLACDTLLKDSKLMSILRHGYVSSYDSKASFPSSGEQEKAAKIFLGMLPCLYYGLKIVFDRSKYNSGFAGWHDISVNSDGKPESALAKFFYAWGFQTIESSGSSTIHLDPLLQAMVLPVLLENLFTPESNGILKNLFQTSKKYFAMNVFTPDPSNPSPTTVRSMLLWLYGLRFTSGFPSLVENS
ncbi:putative variant erythrocyte surface antigen-1, partial [Babesia divergens]